MRAADDCPCPWAHCRLLCVTSCDHNDPCPHHTERFGITTLTLEPPCDLINANSRLHHHAKAKLTRIWRAATREAAHEIGPLKFEHAHIVVTVRFPNNTRRDVGNWFPTAKACVDGLVDAGVIEDDSDLYITGPDMRRERPNGPLRVTITLTEEIAA